MQRTSLRQPSRRAKLGLLLCIAALLILLAAALTPVYQFNIALMEKKSGNTFPGDERYAAARAQAEEVYAKYSGDQAFKKVTLTEDQLTRINSKGKETSTMTFTVRAQVEKTALDFMASGIGTGRLLLLALALAALGFCLIACTRPVSLPAGDRRIPNGALRLRKAAAWMALAALLLVPVFYFATVRLVQRGLLMEIKNGAAAQLVPVFDGFLMGGRGGEEASSLLAGLMHGAMPGLWLMACAMALLLAGTLVLCQETLSLPLRRGALYLFVIVLCVAMLYPYYAMLITALRSNAETTDMYFTAMLPREWKFSNLTDIFSKDIPTYLLNSLLLSGGATAIALVCGIPAAYAMARMRFKGRGVFLGFVIMSQMFAPIVLLVGISRLMNMLHLNNTLLGLMLINAAFNQAFAIWLLRGTFVAISPEMEQAACIDGCNTVTALIRVLLPMAMPGIVTTLIFVFINAWNEYTVSTVLITAPLLRPITVGITQFSSFNMIQWHYLFASALLATIPVVILFMIIEKHLVSGLTSGGVKG